MSFLTTDEARQQILEEIGTSGHERVSPPLRVRRWTIFNAGVENAWALKG